MHKYVSGTGSMGAYSQAMALNAGQLLVFYDEPDNFKRAHGICAGGSDAMSTTLSVYDGASASRVFIDETYSSHVRNPHFIIHMSMQPHKYEEIMKCLRDNGGAPRFLVSDGVQCPNGVERVNFKDRADDVLQYILLETVYKMVLEHMTARSLYCSISGHVTRVQYSLLVEAVLCAGDIIVCFSVFDNQFVVFILLCVFTVKQSALYIS